MNNRVNFNRRTERQYFSNYNSVLDEEQFNNRKSSKRTSNRRSGRENFKNLENTFEKVIYALFFISILGIITGPPLEILAVLFYVMIIMIILLIVMGDFKYIFIGLWDVAKSLPGAS